MARLLYLSHPEVRINAAVPVPEWGLNSVGARRVANWVCGDVFRRVTRVVSSAECKALETASPIAAAVGQKVEIRPHMHENDRSATGFLPGPEFEAVANAFFADPETSVRGWERALDAQRRIAGEVQTVLSDYTDGDLLLVGHGGVGTLLWCHLLGLKISRRHDQPAGGGNLWAVTVPDCRRLFGWTRVESL